MYIIYRVFIYDVMQRRHYHEDVNNGCSSSAVTENNNQIFSCNSCRKCWNLSQIVCSM